MNHFGKRAGVLHAEDVSLVDLAQRFDTPVYVYSQATIARHVRVLTEAIAQLPHRLCYAVKANGNLALLDLIRALGVGFDAVSLGELKRLEQIAAAPETIIFSGVGKRDDEIRAALAAGVLYICVESAEELDAISRIAAERGTPAPVSIRVNPDVDPKTHPYIATGMKENKFGVPIDAAQQLYHRELNNPHLSLVGVTCHIGSQITELTPFVDAASLMADFATSLRAMGVPLQHLGMGGGLGVPYSNSEKPPDPAHYGRALADILAPTGLTIVFEPGRVIVGNAGILLTRVVRVKPGSDRLFVIVDAGMNDLVRPSLYGAKHVAEAVTATGEVTAVDLVGPVCESADTFGKGILLPPLVAGDLIALRTAGAYGFAMASTYNGRPLPAEVLVSGQHAQLIRHRGTYEDLWRGESRLG